MGDPTHKRDVDVPSIQGVLATGAATAILGSVIYNWAFFYALGYLREDFVTLNDAVTSALSWLPPTAMLMFLGLAVAFFRQSKPSSTTNKSIERTVTWAEWAVILFLIIAFGFGGLSLAPLLLVLGAVATMSLIVKQRFEWNYIRFGTRTRIIAMFAPILVGYALSDGIRDGYGARTGQTFDYSLRAADQTQINSVKVIRFFERGVLYRRSSDRLIVFTPWEKLTELSVADPVAGPSPLACEVFPRFCVRNGAAVRPVIAVGGASKRSDAVKPESPTR